MSWPKVTEHFPWGHRTLKVGTKAFVFMGGEEGTFSLSLKLPVSGLAALDLPFVTPTGYGLGKSGWVTCTFGPGEAQPTDLLLTWLRESYEAVAPKRLLQDKRGGAPTLAAKASRAAKSAGPRKPREKTARAAKAPGAGKVSPPAKRQARRKPTT